MNWLETWDAQIDWFAAYGADPAYSWAAFFPSLLKELRDSPAAVGLYVHRNGTSLVISRFAPEKEARIWEGVVVRPLPSGRLEARAYAAGGATLRFQSFDRALVGTSFAPWLRFAAGEHRFS